MKDGLRCEQLINFELPEKLRSIKDQIRQSEEEKKKFLVAVQCVNLPFYLLKDLFFIDYPPRKSKSHTKIYFLISCEQAYVRKYFWISQTLPRYHNHECLSIYVRGFVCWTTWGSRLRKLKTQWDWRRNEAHSRLAREMHTSERVQLKESLTKYWFQISWFTTTTIVWSWWQSDRSSWSCFLFILSLLWIAERLSISFHPSIDDFFHHDYNFYHSSTTPLDKKVPTLWISCSKFELIVLNSTMSLR